MYANDTSVSVDTGGGCRLWPGYLDREQQCVLRDFVLDSLEVAPLFTPEMPGTGKPFSVRMTNLGPLGWVSDRTGGYRYQRLHPVTKHPWPAMPALLLTLWERLTQYEAPPEACLVNRYSGSARMGLHKDADEEALDAPVLSVSLGDAAVFRLGGAERSSPSRSFQLKSGDVLMLSGESRHWFHGVDRVIPGSSTLLPDAGRINLTLRRVTVPPGLVC